MTIRRAAVLGSGTMGAAIAAHLANAGIPTLLLDLPTDGPDRNAIARAGLDRAAKAKPASFMDPARAAPITVGNLEDDLPKLADCDWIEEAIVEKLEVKHALWEKVEKVVGPNAIISSNSSGIPMRMQLEGRGADFRRRFCGAHFFNPPRWLHLLELIPTPETDPAVLATLQDFGDRVLGKGIVIANDVPGFVGNRVGVYAMLHAVRVQEKLGLSVEVVDALTGPILGRPKSATLRTADVTGIDVLYYVAQGLGSTTNEDFTPPAILTKLMEKKWLGEKSGQGLYKRVKDARGRSEIHALNLQTLEYAPAATVDSPELGAIAKQRSALERTKALLALEGPMGDFTRETIYEMMHFAAEKVGVVCAEPATIDNAMKWGFGWELGPFALYDGLGHQQVADAFQKLGKTVPALLQKHLAEGKPFYAPGAAASDATHLSLASYKAAHPTKIVHSTKGASLIDLGDGVLLCEYHSKANAMGDDAIATIRAALEIVPKGFAALVIGNEGQHFSAGANLAGILEMAQNKQFEALDKMISDFQGTVVALRGAPFPVVAAGFGMALGGGCETLLATDKVQAHAELYCGLVELGVGLIPAGGGTAEMLIRFTQALHPGAELFEAPKRAFELIAMGKVSASALEARNLGFLRPVDAITMNKRRLLSDAKAAALALARDYVAPTPRSIPVMGEAGLANLKYAAMSLKLAGLASDHDVWLASGLAKVLSGGTQNFRATVSEQHLLDLEREVFLECCAHPKSQERIAHMLTKGKPLRN
ncbi:MAG: 3-hydroxyacyl-CoA dehydrogenase [Verrucomicrobia bacterium]|nr:3-hydroxyacyl-CoA dehydrogenase [Verrucomicrobiota bacterium]